MASDGLWDVISCHDAVNFVRRQLFVHGTIERAAQELLAKAIERGSSDNISVVVVCLNQSFSTSNTAAVGESKPRKKKLSNCVMQ